MSGIAYDLKKIRGIVFDMDGVLSPSVCPVGDDGRPVRMMNVKDGYALRVAHENGIKIAVISGGLSEKMKKRLGLIGICDVHMEVKDKMAVLTDWMARNDLKPEEVAFMGDDIPDLKAMRTVGLPCAPYDAAYEARETALYVSRFNGGYGCVRDLTEQILRAHNLFKTE